MCCVCFIDYIRSLSSFQYTDQIYTIRQRYPGDTTSYFGPHDSSSGSGSGSGNGNGALQGSLVIAWSTPHSRVRHRFASLYIEFPFWVGSKYSPYYGGYYLRMYSVHDDLPVRSSGFSSAHRLVLKGNAFRHKPASGSSKDASAYVGHVGNEKIKGIRKWGTALHPENPQFPVWDALNRATAATSRQSELDGPQANRYGVSVDD